MFILAIYNLVEGATATFDRIVKVGSYTKPHGGCGEAGWYGEGDGCFASGAE